MVYKRGGFSRNISKVVFVLAKTENENLSSPRAKATEQGIAKQLNPKNFFMACRLGFI